MKRLIISFKSPSAALDTFKNAFKDAKKGKLAAQRYEISFDNKKDFDRFVRNIFLLSNILAFKPKSIYESCQTLGYGCFKCQQNIGFLRGSRSRNAQSPYSRGAQR